MGLYGQTKVMGRNWNLPAPDRKERMAIALWDNMVHTCHDKSIPRADRKGIMSSRFKDYRAFWDWFKEQPCSDLDHVYLNKDLLYEGNRVYSDATCVLLPKQIHDVLKQCRITRSDLEALNQEFGSSVLADGENALEGAFKTAKAEMEACLRLLADKHRHDLDIRAYNALIRYEVKIID